MLCTKMKMNVQLIAGLQNVLKGRKLWNDTSYILGEKNPIWICGVWMWVVCLEPGEAPCLDEVKYTIWIPRFGPEYEIIARVPNGPKCCRNHKLQ